MSPRLVPEPLPREPILPTDRLGSALEDKMFAGLLGEPRQLRLVPAPDRLALAGRVLWSIQVAADPDAHTYPTTPAHYGTWAWDFERKAEALWPPDDAPPPLPRGLNRYAVNLPDGRLALGAQALRGVRRAASQGRAGGIALPRGQPAPAASEPLKGRPTVAPPDEAAFKRAEARLARAREHLNNAPYAERLDAAQEFRAAAAEALALQAGRKMVTKRLAGLAGGR